MEYRKQPIQALRNFVMGGDNRRRREEVGRRPDSGIEGLGLPRSHLVAQSAQVEHPKQADGIIAATGVESENQQQVGSDNQQQVENVTISMHAVAKQTQQQPLGDAASPIQQNVVQRHVEK